eukprot:CFRG5330T1
MPEGSGTKEEETLQSASKMLADMSISEITPNAHTIDDMSLSIGDIVRNLDSHTQQQPPKKSNDTPIRSSITKDEGPMFQTSNESHENLSFLMNMLGAMHGDKNDSNSAPTGQETIQSPQSYLPNVGSTVISETATNENDLEAIDKLFDAIRNDFYEYIEHQLHMKTIDPNCENSQGSRPLILAAKIPTLRIIKLLISYGADVNQTDNKGWTAMHWAARMSNTAAVKLLLEANANVELLTDSGKSVKDIALETINSNHTLDLLQGSTAYHNELPAQNSNQLFNLPSFKLDCNSKIFTDPNYNNNGSAPTRNSISSYADPSFSMNRRDSMSQGPSPGSVRSSLSVQGSGSDINGIPFLSVGFQDPNQDYTTPSISHCSSMPMGSQNYGTMSHVLGQTSPMRSGSPLNQHTFNGMDQMPFDQRAQRRMTAPNADFADNDYGSGSGADVFPQQSFPPIRRTTLDNVMNITNYRQPMYNVNSLPVMTSANNSPSISPNTSPRMHRSPKMMKRTSLTGAHSTLGIPYTLPSPVQNKHNSNNQSYTAPLFAHNNGNTPMYTHGSAGSPVFAPQGAGGGQMYGGSQGMTGSTLYTHGQSNHIYNTGAWNPLQSGLNVGAPGSHHVPTTPDRLCIECGTSKTPQWRRSEDGSVSLCNACGLKLKHKMKKAQKAAEASKEAASNRESDT